MSFDKLPHDHSICAQSRRAQINKVVHHIMTSDIYDFRHVQLPSMLVFSDWYNARVLTFAKILSSRTILFSKLAGSVASSVYRKSEIFIRPTEILPVFWEVYLPILSGDVKIMMSNSIFVSGRWVSTLSTPQPFSLKLSRRWPETPTFLNIGQDKLSRTLFAMVNITKMFIFVFRFPVNKPVTHDLLAVRFI